MEGSYTTNQETKECRLTKIKTRVNNKEQKLYQQNKKFRSMSTQIHEKSRNVKTQMPEPAELRSGEEATAPCGARNSGNTYDFQEVISSTYTMWVLMK